MQPTIRSLARCIDHAKEHDLTTELIVVLDRSDKQTKTYVRKSLPQLVKNADIVTRIADYGDLGLSRNCGIDATSGQIIGVLDADDLFTENLITNCVKAIMENKQIIAHPEYVVSFGDWSEVWHLRSSSSPEFIKASVVENNPWSSLSFAHKSIREKYRYKPTHITTGFGPEDWQWNIDTLGDGVNHLVVGKTAYFYRRKNVGSLGTAYKTNRPLLSKTQILRDQSMVIAEGSNTKENYPQNKTIAQYLSIIPRWFFAKLGILISPLLAHTRRTHLFEHHLRLAFKELFSTAPPVPEIRLTITLPDWLINEWQALHMYEHKIFPDTQLLKNIGEHNPQPTMFTQVYWSLIKEINLNSEYIFLVPRVTVGGADLVATNYINAILHIRPNAKVTVIVTEKMSSEWETRLPRGVKFITLNDDFHSLTPDQQTRIIGIVLLQIEPSVIHLVNSVLGFRLFTEYSERLAKVADLYISAFSVDYLRSGQRAHYLLDHLSYSIEFTKKVFADNQNIVNQLILWQGLPKKKFSVHYQPYSGRINSRIAISEFSSRTKCKVLWASRLTRSKHPEILVRLAEESAKLHLPIEFYVYGRPGEETIDSEYLAEFQKQNNIKYKGGFDGGLQELSLGDYDLFLMTTEYEGLPNVLIEATAGGLPVMAPSVGGIPEFIQPGKTGFLIESYTDIEDYIKQLSAFLNHPEDGRYFLKNAQKLLRERHSWNVFINQLKEEGYISLK